MVAGYEEFLQVDDYLENMKARVATFNIKGK